STVFPTGVPGLYIPTESGTYNPGGIVVDTTDGYTQLVWDGTTLVKVLFPIDLTGYASVTALQQVEDDVSTVQTNVNILTGDVNVLQNTKENTANKNTTINDSDIEFPTSRAVLDYVATFAGASYGGNVTPEDVPTPTGN